MLQVSMDGPSVNWIFYEKFIESREISEVTGLINIGSCGLYFIHKAFKSGAMSCEWDIVKILKGLYALFNDTPARRSDYIDITGSNLFPKSFCATKSIEDSDVAESSIEIWDNILKIFKFWESLPKHKRPSSKSYSIVQEATRDNMILAKLQFFTSVANLHKPFLAACQTRDPVVPFVCDDLHSLARGIISDCNGIRTHNHLARKRNRHDRIYSQEKLCPGLLNQLCWRKQILVQSCKKLI